MPLPDPGPDEEAADASPQPRPKVALTLGFVVAGILVIAYAAWTDPILQIPLTAQFGLLQLMPAEYWFGMALLGVAVVLAARSDSDLLFVVVGATLLGMFAVTPGLFQINPPVSDAYYHFSYAQTIDRTGRLPADPTTYPANWPGLYLVIAFANLLGQPAPLEIIRFFPLYSGVLTFVCLFAFLRSFFSPAIARSASLLSTFLDAWAQYHLSPEGIGLALALLVLATAWERRVPLRVANTVVFLGLVVSHATTAIFLLAFFGIDALFAALRPRQDAVPQAGGFVPAFNPILAYAAVWLGWLFFIASGSASIARVAVVTQIGRILNVGQKTANILVARSVENIFLVPPLIRLGALGFFGILGLVGLLVLVRHREERGRVRFLAASLLGLGVLAAADALFLGGLFSDRPLMFFSVFVPGLCLYAFRGAPRVPRTHDRPSPSTAAIGRAVFLFLLVVALVSASTTYYQAAFDFTPPQSAAVSNFFQTHASAVFVLDGTFPQPVWALDQQSQSWQEARFYAVYPATLQTFSTPTPAFAVYDQVSTLWYLQGHGINIYEYYVGQQANYSLVYDNGFAQAYLLYHPAGG